MASKQSSPQGFQAEKIGSHIQLYHGDELVMKVTPSDAELIAGKLMEIVYGH